LDSREESGSQLDPRLQVNASVALRMFKARNESLTTHKPTTLLRRSIGVVFCQKPFSLATRSRAHFAEAAGTMQSNAGSVLRKDSRLLSPDTISLGFCNQRVK
jgi:hypothetical protein